jgi:hypothetical protein
MTGRMTYKLYGEILIEGDYTIQNDEGEEYKEYTRTNILGRPMRMDRGDYEIVDVAEGICFVVVGPCDWPPDKPWHVNFQTVEDNEWGTGFGGHYNGIHRATKEEAMAYAESQAAKQRRYYKRLNREGQLIGARQYSSYRDGEG